MPAFRGNYSKGPVRKSNGFGRQQESYKAVCAKCGNECQLPFRPTGSKPVYCKDCFAKNEANPVQSEDMMEIKEMLDKVNSKLDKMLKIMNMD
ncbi:MAG TPA: CxxC-x17-CxxC domain-containing protein [Candidatus Nanoarchaeia archaeon]|nr:CxxC-x17-CxxC domain-containing protein [Candidatus Nanoarchaeia archaeon]